MLRVDSPRFQAALRQVEDSIDEAWRALCEELGATAGTPDEAELAETVLAETVLQDPAEFEWRVVDGAMQRLSCADCAQPLGAGPVGCAKCDLANGFRFAAREVDRPNVAPGNEDDELERLVSPADLDPRLGQGR